MYISNHMPSIDLDSVREPMSRICSTWGIHCIHRCCFGWLLWFLGWWSIPDCPFDDRSIKHEGVNNNYVELPVSTFFTCWMPSDHSCPVAHQVLYWRIYILNAGVSPFDGHQCLCMFVQMILNPKALKQFHHPLVELSNHRFKQLLQNATLPPTNVPSGNQNMAIEHPL